MTERSVRSRVAAAWGRWRKVASLVINRSTDLKTRGMVYETCVKSSLLYGTETNRQTVECPTKICPQNDEVHGRSEVAG